MKPKILLLSGYDAASHCYWRSLLQDNLGHYQWTQIALAPRHFAWRTRGSSATLAFRHRKILQQRYDLIIVTSMVDLASLRGFLPHLAAVPTVVYFHENQFVYPVSNAQPNIVNAQLTSVYSALCADVVVFNSQYNRRTFYDGSGELFRRLPESVPLENLEACEKTSRVIPVPIELNGDGRHKQLEFQLKGEAIELVWNHRWEYDKQPEVFFNALKLMKQAKYRFKLHIMGQSFRQVPSCFEEAKSYFTEEISSWGFQPQSRYEAILSKADIVISTALHDFQGLSMMQAIAKGCLPVAPKRVAYPEYMLKENLYSVAGSERHSEVLPQDEAERLFEHLKQVLARKDNKIPDICHYSTDNLLDDYDSLFSSLIKG